MTEGGTLGFYCQHAYAHTNDNHRNSLPYALKGVDAMFYSIFHHMGLEVQVRPVMKDLPDDEYLEYLKYEDPELRTQPGARSRLTGTELHCLTLSNNGRFEGSPPPMMVYRMGPHNAPNHAD